MERPGAVERVVDGRHLSEDRLEERLHLGNQRPRRLEPGERLEHRRRLEERVVGSVRVRRMAAATAEDAA